MTSHDQESSFLLSVNANLDAIVSPAEHSMKQLTAQPSAAVPASPPVPEADPSPHVLPIPTMTATQPQSSFRFSRAIVPPEGDWTCLPADIANADISIARKFVHSCSEGVVAYALVETTILSTDLAHVLVFSRWQLCRNLFRSCCAGAEEKIRPIPWC